MVTSAASGRSARHNLPASLTSFIGRERELAEVQARLAAGRLLTLTGVGGCGKTRLALEVAGAVLDQYTDGVWLVEVGPIADAALVPHSVAAVVGVRESAGQSTINALATRLRARRLLLVLDNSAPQQLRAVLAAAVRARFGGKITYASVGRLEGVDWTLFDFVALDAYRSVEVTDRYREGIRALVSEWRECGKPVAITEFGCTTHRGAADKGARGGNIVEWDGATPVRLDGEYTRDEAEQATYLRELLDIFRTEGVDSAFAFTFAAYHLPHRASPRDDLDMASYGVVKVLEDHLGQTYPDLVWEPKLAFHALAEAYSE